jgi:DNA repair exonuclease SbcCD ATPase subunit
MSEFIHRTKIAALKQSNVKLNQVISNLEAELHDLKCELERLRRENLDEKKQLKERIPEFEYREEELKEPTFSITREAKSNNKKHVVVKQLLSALQVEDAAIVEAAIEQYYKKKGVPKIIIAFLFGVLCPLVVWWISTYSENNKFYNSIIEQMNKVVDYIM